ncbi:ComEC/Rec2 family competence protein [Corynebacterium sanguinis]|uniref:ComEC/Rec2 family competence protein n=1 Tax=Corynebacterium sanguinis TaxID=2594913 RepID=UPI00223BD52F|nr:ComEC/Rec2 family competence protein [Corynebacterium sanguinis]MCT1804787.1 ComEC/Rec2 family competence protein [Corynebacterium sanguinis]MCT2157831.1 ComEC/Rec2 family competence protein [Corynebacterium sanguinis]
MSELRLAPAAVAVWTATLAALVWGPVVACAAVAAVCAAVACARQWGQVVLVAGLGCVAGLVTTLRVATARAWQFGAEVVGTVSGAARPIEGHGYLLRVGVAGHPGPIAVFVDDLPLGVVNGAAVRVTGRASEAEQAGTAQVVFNGEVEVLSAPTGMAAWSNHVKETFAASVAHTVGPRAQGLIPGMVLGDTSLQSQAQQQAYLDTGLSHLSAVSGSNVAIVTAAAAVLASALGLGLRGRIVFAAAALALFAGLVGPEPSVLRASVTGLVGLAAVLASSTAEPVHTLCLAVIGLVLIDSNLAVSFGFALSVAATASIVALSPLLYRYLVFTRWPEIVVRALAVAVAADIVTMPLVALMSGEVSIVAVLANILVVPVTAPVTVLGLVAVVLSLAPGGLEVPILWVIEPLAAWVDLVATTGAAFPGATVEAGPLGVIVCYGWVLAGFMAQRPRLTLTAVAAALAVAGPGAQWHKPVELNRLTAHVVERESGIEPVPAHTQVVVVLEGGQPHDRPVSTTGGLPVLYPNRDGPVWLYPDGTQRAASGRF